MNKKREIKGIWHLPESPEIGVGGILTYEPGENIILELIGDLKQRTDFTEYFQDSNQAVIYGISSEGKKISLYECRGSFAVKTYAVPLTSYSASAFIEGSYQQNHTEELFDEIEADFQQLAQWFGKNAYEWTREMIEPKFYQTTVKYNPNNDFNAVYDIENNFKLKLSLEGMGEMSNEICTVTSLSTVSILHKAAPLSAWDMIRKMEIFRSFLSLGLLQSVPYNFIRLREKATGEFLNYFFVERGAVYHTKNKPFLYNFSRVESKLDSLLKSWYDSARDMFPIRVHLLEAILHKPSFRSTDFMILSFAIEGFYRRFLKKNNAKSGNLISAISDIQLIFKDLSFIDRIMVCPYEINDSRNYYAHLYSKDPSRKILSGIDLLKTSEKVKVLLVLSLLKQMGLKIPEIENCVAHSDLLKSVNSF